LAEYARKYMGGIDNMREYLREEMEA